VLPGWSWDVPLERWKEGFSHLKQFSEREGHCRVPNRYKTDDGYRLGEWVSKQKRAKNTMAPDRRQRLEALPGWVWKVEKSPRGLGQPSGGAVIALETAAQALAEGASEEE
jgi:Helicase associated domain